MALIDAADVRAEIQGLTASDDAELGLLIAEADALAAGWCAYPQPAAGGARTLSQATYVELLDGPSAERAEVLDLVIQPIASVTSIYDDDERAYGAGTLVASSEYDVQANRGRVVLKSSATHAWSRSWEAIKVTYVGGFNDASPPADAKKALILIVGALWQRRIVAGLPHATEITPQELIPVEARRLLSPYRLLWRHCG